VQPVDDRGAALARRLRALREGHWPGRHLTQGQLADALGQGGGLSPPAISSWENGVKIPPSSRLDAYATFFATRRSISGSSYRLLDPTELTEEESRHRAQLHQELTRLRSEALMEPVPPARTLPPDEPIGRGTWHFADQRAITLVCAPLPERLRRTMPYADPQNPDFIEAYTYADVDALIELFGHLRAANPSTEVHFRLATDLLADDYTTHLVLLGGVDWNVITREVQSEIDLPVRQQSVNLDDPHRWDAWFEVGDGEARQQFRPRLTNQGGQQILQEDVAHFFRAANPFNHKRTVTVCNGMYGRGTFGAVRALTDARFRERNEEFVRQRFGGSETFSILMRVRMARGKVITPDWTQASTRLHEWPEAE
jgi:transcriptional regulator with XRE-family HTH domain